MRTYAGYDCVRISIILLLLCIFPTAAYAFAGGTGARDDPFQVATVQHLVLIGSDARLLDKCYRVVADIDLAPDLPDGRVFSQAIIAPDTDSANGFHGLPFTGRFDGGGHAIRHLTISGGSKSYLGLFGALGESAEVIDLSLAEADITGEKDGAYLGGVAGMNDGYITACCVGGNISGDYGVGAIAGQNARHGTIIRCTATGKFEGKGRVEVVGGLVGLNDGKIAKCSVQGVCLSSRGFMDSLGGLAGFNSGSIRACYADGELDGESCLGGLVAVNVGSISSCHARADLRSRVLSHELGGLVGSNSGTVANCYTNGTILNAFPETSLFGGLIGRASETARTINCFWDAEVSGILASEGGIGLTTSQMTDPEVFSLNGWGSDPNWVLDPFEDFPRFAWEDTPGQAIPLPFIDWFHGSGIADDPYLIETMAQLVRIGTASVLWDKAFVLMSDIDLAETTFPRIGICPGTDFTGTFDGSGHSIGHLGIHMSESPEISYVGMFGYVGPGGQVFRLNLEEASIQCAWGAKMVGILAGANEGLLVECFTSGSVSGGDYSMNLGQLVGRNTGRIEACASAATVSSGKDSHNIGGLVGSEEEQGLP